MIWPRAAREVIRVQGLRKYAALGCLGRVVCGTGGGTITEYDEVLRVGYITVCLCWRWHRWGLGLGSFLCRMLIPGLIGLPCCLGRPVPTLGQVGVGLAQHSRVCACVFSQNPCVDSCFSAKANPCVVCGHLVQCCCAALRVWLAGCARFARKAYALRLPSWIGALRVFSSRTSSADCTARQHTA